MLKKTVVLLVSLFMILSFSARIEAQLCVPASTYDALAWTWEYYGPCDSSYNCLAYSLGITNSWVWPWGSSLPTDSQVTSYMATKGYSTSGTVSKIISYGSTSGILHFSKVLGSSTCLAKCGQLNILKHYSWDPYKPSGSYGPKVRVYKTTPTPPPLKASIYGRTRAYTGETFTWCADVSGGTPPYSYEWKHSMGGPHYSYPWGTTECREYTTPSADVYLKLTVTDSAGVTAIAYSEIINMGNNNPYPERLVVNQFEMLDAYIPELEFTIKSTSNSPNPYDYIDNEAFKKIVALGPEVLESIKHRILSSRSNGLTQYILAIAAEKIAAVNLKKESILWDNPKDWARSWDKFLVDLPAKVEAIVNGKLSSEEMENRLVNLGFAALPILKDRIDSGEPGLNGAFDKLVGKLEFKESARSASNSLEEIIDTYRNLIKK